MVPVRRSILEGNPVLLSVKIIEDLVGALNIEMGILSPDFAYSKAVLPNWQHDCETNPSRCLHRVDAVLSL